MSATAAPPEPSAPPAQAALPPGAHAVARLLIGRPTSVPLDPLPEPWRTLAAAAAASPAERMPRVRELLLGLPDAVELTRAILAVDPLQPEPEDLFVICSLLPGQIALPTWPEPPAAAALHGLAGDFVRLIEPHTEADPAGLLVQFLVAFGNAAGRTAWFIAEAQRHHPNLFAVLVGKSAKGRKGSAWSQVQQLLDRLDPRWSRDHVKSGLSSGEGLIYAVRDPLGEDGGVADKRLLAKEEEFALVLRVLKREGNTLSALLRQAWDSGTLRTLTRGNPLTATGAHISMIGHVTADELRRYLTSTEAGNGFGNRFLWLCVRRVRSLPEGGRPNATALEEVCQHLRYALDFAATAGELERDAEARELWLQVYEKLAEGQDGLFGAVTGRAEGQVMRLALVYALLDLSSCIRRPHLEAALALWRYCEASARYVFGDDGGNPDAEIILAALEQRSQGMTRSEILLLFQRHRSAADLGRALAWLAEQGLVEARRELTGGRPSERWLVRRTAPQSPQ